jgi:hypothetical protein
LDFLAEALEAAAKVMNFFLARRTVRARFCLATEAADWRYRTILVEEYLKKWRQGSRQSSSPHFKTSTHTAKHLHMLKISNAFAFINNGGRQRLD